MMQGRNGKPQKPTNGKAIVSRQITLSKSPPIDLRPDATELQQVHYLQKLIVYRASRKECSDIALARLCAAYAVLGDRKRILRGIPLPGQFRPDLDPVQLAKALRRQNTRQITDVQQVHRATFSDEPEKKETKEAKESLQTEGGDHGTKGGEGRGKDGA